MTACHFMNYRVIGKSDMKVSEVGFGAWQAGRKGWGTDYDDESIIEAIRRSVDAGLNYIDTAETYGDGHSEEVVGRAISSLPREDIIIATKVKPPHFTHDGVIKSANESMRRLGVKYIDHYQLHWPDASVPVKETLSAMEELVDQGKVRYIGVCNYNAEELENMISLMKRHEIVSDQVKYNIIDRDPENGLMQFLASRRMTLVAWSPIAKGLLSGKYTAENLPKDDIRSRDRLFTKETLAKINPLLDYLRKIADLRGKTVSQVSLNYLLCMGAEVIPGAKNAAQALENVGASGWRLNGTEISEIKKLATSSD